MQMDASIMKVRANKLTAWSNKRKKWHKLAGQKALQLLIFQHLCFIELKLIPTDC